MSNDIRDAQFEEIKAAFSFCRLASVKARIELWAADIEGEDEEPQQQRVELVTTNQEPQRVLWASEMVDDVDKWVDIYNAVVEEHQELLKAIEN